MEHLLAFDQISHSYRILVTLLIDSQYCHSAGLIQVRSQLEPLKLEFIHFWPKKYLKKISNFNVYCPMVTILNGFLCFSPLCYCDQLISKGANCCNFLSNLIWLKMLLIGLNCQQMYTIVYLLPKKILNTYFLCTSNF